MKKIYFRDTGAPIILRVPVYAAASITSALFPKLAISTAYKVLSKPFGRRKYEFDNPAPTAEYIIPSLLGDIKLYQFGTAKKAVVLTHGWADNVRSFRQIIRSLASDKHSIWCFDHVAHGKSTGDVAHLFAFIDGLERVLKHLDSNDFQLDAIISHSMGGVAVLNLPEEQLKQIKVIPISMPVLFFESLFKTMKKIGVPRKLLLMLLKDAGSKFNKHFENLSPAKNKHKLGPHFLFIHDETDTQSLYKNIVNFTKDTEVQFMKTEGFGHSRILIAPEVLRRITQFIQ